MLLLWLTSHTYTHTHTNTSILCKMYTFNGWLKWNAWGQITKWLIYDRHLINVIRIHFNVVFHLMRATHLSCKAHLSEKIKMNMRFIRASSLYLIPFEILNWNERWIFINIFLFFLLFGRKKNKSNTVHDEPQQ